MGMTLNNGMVANLATQPVNATVNAIGKRVADYQKSEYLFKYMYRTEGLTGTEVGIQLPGIYGVDNLKTQPDFNTGSEINEIIKRQNELIKLITDTVSIMKEKNKKTCEIDIPEAPGVFIRIWKLEEKKELSLNNFFHRQEAVIRFID